MRATRARWALFGGLALLAVLATPASARADAVTDWNQTAAAALQSPGTAVPPGAGQGAVSTVHLAMVHAAVYDAVNAIVGCQKPYVSSPVARRWYSQDAAVAAAARHVLVNGGLGIPAARMPVIEAAYQAALLPIPDGPAKAGGIATGEAAATEVARGARRGRSLRAVPLRGVDPAGPLAAGAAGDGDRSGSVAEGRHTVRAPRSGPVPRPAAPPPPLAGVRGRLQRGEGDRVGDQYDPDARPDGSGQLLGRDQRDRDDGERHPLGREHPGRQPGRPRPAAGARVHERGGRADRDLARQGPVQLLAAVHRDPRGGERRQPRDRGPIRPGRR